MQRQFSVASATLRGVEAELVNVEVSLGSGIPGMSIVGMPDTAVQEARERVKAAIRSSGFQMPREKIVVNLAPGSVKKSGSGFDLPIALGLLAASGQLNPALVEQMLVVGELSLEGVIREVTGMLAFELLARNEQLGLICSSEARSVLDIPRLEIRAAKRLADFREGFFEAPLGFAQDCEVPLADFSEVGGQELAKRALQISAAGGHGILMVGPPGSGKTMLSSRVPSILPDLEEFERIQVAQVYSAAGQDISEIVNGRRPFRHPHHSISKAGLLGGGKPIRPGEVSLAHLGVCFLDEIAEFSPSTLQGLRQPLEDGQITLVRAEGAYVFPARFMLVAASNPCPCGYYGDPEKPCTCSAVDVSKYQARIGGPLLDRIDLQIDVWRSKFDQVVRTGSGASSADLKEGVLLAREYRSWRLSRNGSAGKPARNANAADLIKLNAVADTAESLLRESAAAFFMSGRAIVKTIRVARTIADIEQSDAVEDRHVGEALSFRIRGGGR